MRVGAQVPGTGSIEECGLTGRQQGIEGSLASAVLQELLDAAAQMS